MSATQTLTETHGPDVAVMKTEEFDVDVAQKILECKEIVKTDKDAVRRLLKNRVRGNKHETTYKLGKDIKHEDLGRFIAVKGAGLQAVPRDCRGALAQKYYWDVDIRNAQATLLQQYAEERGWVCENLRHFNEHRDEYIEELKTELQIDRWEAKQKVCRVMFGGGAEGLTEFFVEKLYPEMRVLMNNVFNENRATYPSIAKKPNAVRSMMAQVLQTEERKVLLAMDRALMRLGRSLDVYIHDGGLVKKKEGETRFPEEMLRKVEHEVQETTGYKVSLAIKPLTTTLDFDDMETDGKAYEERKKEWEVTGWKGATWFKLRHPPCFVALFPDGKIDQMSKKDLLQNEEDNLLTSGTPFVKEWLVDPAKREYLKLVFAPKLEPPTGCFNLFQGFINVPAEGDFSAYQTCLRLVSNNEQQVFDYIENWLAHVIQKPSVKTKVAICIQGDQGAGKDTFWDAVGDNILGPKYYLSTKTPENDIFAKFNSRAGYKVLVKFEEADFQTNKENASKLKGLITSTHGHIEKKGHDPIELDDYTNIVMTTNSEVPVVIEETDRRFVLVNASSERLGDTPFWDDIHAKLPVQASAYHHYLLTKDISNFIPWNPATIPRTQYYKDVKQSFIPYHARFFQRQIELEMELNFTAHSLFTRMKGEAPASLQLSETKFGRDMRKYVDAGCFMKQKTDKHNSYVGDSVKLRAYLEAKSWWVDY